MKTDKADIASGGKSALLDDIVTANQRCGGTVVVFPKGTRTEELLSPPPIAIEQPINPLNVIAEKSHNELDEKD